MGFSGAVSDASGGFCAARGQVGHQNMHVLEGGWHVGLSPLQAQFSL